MQQTNRSRHRHMTSFQVIIVNADTVLVGFKEAEWSEKLK